MTNVVKIARVYTEDGPVFFIPNMDRYLIVMFEDGEEPGTYDISMTMKTVGGNIEQIFEHCVEVDIEHYNGRLRRLCSRFDEIDRRYGSGCYGLWNVDEADMKVIDRLGELCREICQM